ncbi:MAG: ABC transporter permease [Mesorhizobium sp.]|nr:MAG: ABC transporter permease [Mesorhizobium sp.]
MTRLVRRQGWVAGLLVLFVVLLVITRLIQPGYGSGDFGSLVRAVLPYAFAVAAQTIVVIAGGIDLSVGAMMALTSVTAASMMDGASEEYALFVVPFVLAMGLVLGAVNGMLIVVTRVPDIVVTLATLFVLQGAALLVLGAPGGAVAEWLRATIVGTVAIPGLPEISAWIPKALVLLVVCLCIIWIPLKRSKLGLSIYAIGSSELAAFRSGVPVARTKIIAYALSGLFAAMGGLALTMSTGIGAPIPGPYLLASVAAVVLGGVALGGGKGGLLGPIVAVFVLRLVRTDLTLLAIDPNVTAIIEGAIMVAVVMFGAFITMRGRRRTPSSPGIAPPQSRAAS